MEEKLYSIKEVAEGYKITEQVVKKWVKSGVLKSFKIGKSVRITESAIQKFIEASNKNKEG